MYTNQTDQKPELTDFVRDGAEIDPEDQRLSLSTGSTAAVVAILVSVVFLLNAGHVFTVIVLWFLLLAVYAFGLKA